MVVDVLPDDAPAPRLCHLIRWEDFDGYGFNLHAERSNPGQFIGKIDDASPAQMAGLREGDRIVEVNGVNISNENHRQVVERIKSDASETRLLVVDPETDAWYKEQEIVIKSSQMNVVYMKTPIPRPDPDSPRAKFHQQQDSPSQEPSSFFPSVESSDSLIASDPVEVVNSAVTADRKQPMSPDSGRGEEELSSQFVTVEAEINRQSPAQQNGLFINQEEVSVVKKEPEQEAHQSLKMQQISTQDQEEQDSLKINSEPSLVVTQMPPAGSSHLQESDPATKVSSCFFSPNRR